MFIDKLIESIKQDPIYFIMAIIALLVIIFITSKSVFERMIDGLADYVTDESKSYKERAEDFTAKIAAGLDLAMDKVGKRKGFINFIKKLVLSDGTKKWLVSIMSKYPSCDKDPDKEE